MGVFRRVRRRSRVDILAEILELALNPILKTQIMYKASLSFAQLHGYLLLMVRRGLLEVIQDEKGNRTAYRTTSKGLRFLAAYKEIKDLLGKRLLGETITLTQKKESKGR